jgi:hypothetical protein
MSEVKWFKVNNLPYAVRVNANDREDTLGASPEADSIDAASWDCQSERNVKDGSWIPCTEAEAMAHIGRKPKQAEPIMTQYIDLRQFWIVWSIDLQRSDDYSNRADAEAEARRRAEESPGETHYVLEAVGAFRAERSVAVGLKIWGGA